MKHFLNVKDSGDIAQMISLAQALKKEPLKYEQLGKGKTIGLIFMNPSLRTRLSTQKAAQNLGLHILMMNFTGEGWALETEDGVIMDGDKAEHVKEAAAVIGSYCDMVAIRTFPGLKDRELDYSEHILSQFVQYCGRPIVNMESATVHPLQSFTDMLTIQEYKKVEKPKIVLTWAPHPRILPQSVSNSFAEWTLASGYDLTIACPKGFELSSEFTQGATVVHNPEEAYQNADFIYAKNWSSYEQYGQQLQEAPSWIVDSKKMALTNNAFFMHCLPVRRNVIVSDEVIESPQSIVIPQAANRLWAAQAVLKTILEA